MSREGQGRLIRRYFINKPVHKIKFIRLNPDLFRKDG
jgi:hypothetical protein